MPMIATPCVNGSPAAALTPAPRQAVQRLRAHADDVAAGSPAGRPRRRRTSGRRDTAAGCCAGGCAARGGRARRRRRAHPHVAADLGGKQRHIPLAAAPTAPAPAGRCRAARDRAATVPRGTGHALRRLRRGAARARRTTRIHAVDRRDPLEDRAVEEQLAVGVRERPSGRGRAPRAAQAPGDLRRVHLGVLVRTPDRAAARASGSAGGHRRACDRHLDSSASARGAALTRTVLAGRGHGDPLQQPDLAPGPLSSRPGCRQRSSRLCHQLHRARRTGTPVGRRSGGRRGSDRVRGRTCSAPRRRSRRARPSDAQGEASCAGEPRRLGRVGGGAVAGGRRRCGHGRCGRHDGAAGRRRCPRVPSPRLAPITISASPAVPRASSSRASAAGVRDRSGRRRAG